MYKTQRDIRRQHGLIVWALYWITDLVSLASISHRLRDLPRWWHPVRFARDRSSKKPTPGWQDAATLVPMGFLTAGGLWLSWGANLGLRWLGSALAVYALADTMNYHFRVLWFDDLTPGIRQSRIAVWSHRRILFLALLGYLQSIMLFAALTPPSKVLSFEDIAGLLQASFLTGTLVEVPKPIMIANVIQVLSSLFFLVIAISVMAEIAYGRREVSRGRK